MTDLLIIGKQVLASQPFSRLLGAELTEFSAKLIELVVPITDDVTQQYGFVHGGVISYAADNALTFAGGLAFEGAAVVTSEFKINYLKPATGENLIARASIVHAGRASVVCRCDVFVAQADDGKETLCAAALGTIVKLQSSKKNSEKLNQ